MPSLSSQAIGVLAPLFPPANNGGGPIRTLEALVAASPERFDVHVLTGDRDLGAAERLPVVFDSWLESESGAKVYYATSSLTGSAAGFRALRNTRPGVLYLNGYFDARFSILPQLLWRFGYWRGAVRLLAPRGEFGQGALSRRSVKKRAYRAVYRALGLHRGVYWHASSDQEAADIRRLWGEDAIVLVRENETLLPARAEDPGESTADVAGPLRAAFLGRITELKGLHIALEALARVKVPVQFDVYGPEEDVDYARRCRALASALPAHIRVNFVGPLEHDHIREALSGHEVLLMPTAGENFGHVIPEALSVSCPVLCSRHTPWTGTLESGGGEALPLDSVAWATAIERLGSATATERLAARRRAGIAYEAWRMRPAEPHVFELLDQALQARRTVKVE